MAWSDIKTCFKVDGSLRDLYVFSFTEESWDDFIQSMLSGPYRTEFWHGEVKQDLLDYSQIRRLQKENATILRIYLGQKIQVNCHFFPGEELELDIDPREVCDEAAFKELEKFMCWLAKSLGKPVFLTHENRSDDVIFLMQPDGT